MAFNLTRMLADTQKTPFYIPCGKGDSLSEQQQQMRALIEGSKRLSFDEISQLMAKAN